MEDPLLNSLMEVYLAQLDSALKIAKVISTHSGDSEGISPDALITGLVYRLMIPMNNDEMISSMDAAKEALDASSSSDEELDEEVSDSVLLSRSVKRNTCNCDICGVARACLIRFPNYESPDRLAEMFQRAIQNACHIHDITI